MDRDDDAEPPVPPGTKTAGRLELHGLPEPVVGGLGETGVRGRPLEGDHSDPGALEAKESEKAFLGRGRQGSRRRMEHQSLLQVHHRLLPPVPVADLLALGGLPLLDRHPGPLEDLDEGLPTEGLEQVVLDPEVDGFLGDLKSFVGGDHDEDHLGKALAQVADGVQATDPRHANIHQHHVGLVESNEFHGFPTVPGRGADRHVVEMLLDEELESVQNRLFVIGDEDLQQG
ncbi:MAG TPA: hypothetical protein VMB23_04270 [Spirochaetia bacterium]|nr:hypothetical protein [Spirochaetia bacterium]